MLSRTYHEKRQRDEEGIILVFVALGMVVLLLFAAFVVDIGGAHSERRQDQTTVDAAALAGAAHLVKGDAVTTAMAVARQNLSTTYSDTDWNSLWANCQDPSRPAQYTKTASATPCISFNSAFTRIRVRLPDQVVLAQFSKAIGGSNLKASALAEAQIQPPAGGGVMPFGEAAVDTTNQMCMTVGGGCGGQNSDTLRFIDSPLIGNPQFGTSQLCRDGSLTNVAAQTRAEDNTAMGLDHLVTTWANSGDVLDDCGGERPNTLYESGLQGHPAEQTTLLTAVARGLSTGTSYPDGGPARLQRWPRNWPGWETRGIVGSAALIDNRPLWEFLGDDTNGSNVPASCKKSNFQSSPNESKMQQCLGDYVNGYGSKQYAPIFTAKNSATPNGLYDAQLSPRLIWVPLLPCSSCDSTLQLPSHVVEFNPAFIQTLYLNSSDTSFANPGEGGSSALSLSAFDGVSALPLTRPMLPASVVDTGPGGGAVPRTPVALIN